MEVGCLFAAPPARVPHAWGHKERGIPRGWPQALGADDEIKPVLKKFNYHARAPRLYFGSFF